VLVPRRLTDEAFWNIYFLLAKPMLPKKAYEAPPPNPPQEQPLLLQKQEQEPSEGVHLFCGPWQGIYASFLFGRECHINCCTYFVGQSQ
jgi:hypothetical protein